jgi:hypothetical protein
MINNIYLQGVGTNLSDVQHSEVLKCKLFCPAQETAEV